MYFQLVGAVACDDGEIFNAGRFCGLYNAFNEGHAQKWKERLGVVSRAPAKPLPASRRDYQTLPYQRSLSPTMNSCSIRRATESGYCSGGCFMK